jgi:S-DNA-T family DNA segregation ATPase FtsK/SpoIIIE
MAKISPAKNDARTRAATMLAPRLREGALIGLLALCLYMLIALITYDERDPGWSHTAFSGQVHNSVGRAGAWLADVLYSLVGFSAFLIPLMLGYRAWLIIRDKTSPLGFDWVTLAVRVIGFLLVLFGATSLLSMHSSSAASSLPFGTGGMLGQALASASLSSFALLGSRLVLLSILLFGLTIFTDLSWLRLIDRIGEDSIRFWHWLQTRSVNFAREYREQREIEEVVVHRKQAIEVEKQKIQARPAPTITLPKPAPVKSERVEKERQKVLFDAPVTGELPPISLLNEAPVHTDRGFSADDLEKMSRLLEIKLREFNIEAEVTSVLPGPVITRFEIQPAPGVKVSRISNIAKDLARSLAVISVRVVEVIPGKSVVGIEIPNEDRETVYLTQVLSSRAYEESKSPVTLALGKDISGEPSVADLARMPHLLVAGTTGSGKSVGVNAMLLSLLFKSTPEDVRLMMVDPKMLELSVYDGIPHLLTPVITDMKDAANGLRWCVGEMERRYRLMASLGVRNLAGYNKKVKDAEKAGEPILDPLWKPEMEFVAGEAVATAPALKSLPYIVVVIDEFADMMMIVGKKVEELIARIAQKARAAGIHLILATQRPSVDVITGLIKANVPTRIAFQVSSKIDSRTILDQGGAEQLLGHGDMLYLPPGTGLPVRVHGAFVADDEVHRVVADWKRRGEPDYIEGLLDDGATESIPGISGGEGGGGEGTEDDALYDEALRFVTETRKASISAVQRKLRIGYNRAARLIESMEAAGVVTAAGHNGQREVLAPPPPR